MKQWNNIVASLLLAAISQSSISSVCMANARSDRGDPNNLSSRSSELISEIDQITKNLPQQPDLSASREKWDDWRRVDYVARIRRIAIIEEIEKENLPAAKLEPYIRTKVEDIKTCFYYTRMGETNRFEGKIYRMMDANSPLARTLATELFWSLNLYHVNTHQMHLSEIDLQQIADFELSRKDQPEAGRLILEAMRMAGLSKVQWSTWILENTNAKSEGYRWVTAKELTSLSLGSTVRLGGRDTSGKEIDWRQFKGKVVLLDFWAFWCGGSLAEIPDLKELSEKHRDKGLRVVGVFNDYRLDQLREYIPAHGMNWPQLVELAASKSGFMHPLAKEYGLTALPCYMLVDRDGKLAATGRKLEQVKPKLLELLKSK